MFQCNVVQKGVGTRSHPTAPRLRRIYWNSSLLEMPIHFIPAHNAAQALLLPHAFNYIQQKTGLTKTSSKFSGKNFQSHNFFRLFSA